jgi:hypothetical protein
MAKPVFFITAPGPQQGKSTVRNEVCRLTGLRGGSCSDVIYHFMAHLKSTSVEELRKLPKEQVRPQLIKLGDWLCGIGPLEELSALRSEEEKVVPLEERDLYRGPSALIRTLFFNGVHVIDGVRRRLEIAHARERLEWMGLRVVHLHVVNPRVTMKDNTEELKDLADAVISNDGTIPELNARVLQTLQTFFPSKPAPAQPRPSDT